MAQVHTGLLILEEADAAAFGFGTEVVDLHLAGAVLFDETAQGDGVGRGDVEVGILAVLDGLRENGDLVADALAVQLIEVALIAGEVLEAHLEVIGFPPGRGHVHIALGACDDQLAFGLCPAAHLDGCAGARIDEIHLRVHRRCGS